jgi:hypothetical protein
MPSDLTNTTALIQAAIKGSAPRLAAALDGPDAAIAIAALGRDLAGDALATPDQVLAALHTADKASIQAAEQGVLSRLQKGGETLELATQVLASSNAAMDASFKDTENARLAQIQGHDTTARILAMGVSAIFGLVLVALVLIALSGRSIDDSVKPLLYTLLGVLATAWTNIIGFYFGSSVGSMQKSQAIQASLMQQSAAPPGGSSP